MNNCLMVIRENVPSFSNIKRNVVKFVGYKKVHNFTVSLRNFLLYILSEKNLLQLDLGKGYTKEEKNEFIYNCAINTINEFYYFEKYHKRPDIMSGEIMDLFDQNFKLRDFEPSEIDSNISRDYLEMIELFKDLKKDLTQSEKNELKIKARKLIASVD